MNKFAVLAASLVLTACQHIPVQKPSPLPQVQQIKENLVLKYANELVSIGSDNYLVKDVILYRINDLKDVNLAFIYNQAENQIKAVLVDCAKRETTEHFYYPVNEVSEKILAGYLPSNDSRATPIRQEPPVLLAIPTLGYSLVCK